MHEDHFGREFYRSRKGHRAFPERRHDGVAIGAHQASLRVDHNPAAREVPVVDAVHRM